MSQFDSHTISVIELSAKKPSWPSMISIYPSPHTTQFQPVLEIPTGPPLLGQQLWRRTGNFLLIFLQFYVYDLRFKTWGPITFLADFQTLISTSTKLFWRNINIYIYIFYNFLSLNTMAADDLVDLYDQWSFVACTSQRMCSRYQFIKWKLHF